MASAGDEPDAGQPSDALKIQSLLLSMGVEDYEPRVVDQLTDFMYKYVTDVVLDAEAYSEHAGKAAGVVEMDDVMLAIQAKTAYSFMQPTPMEIITESATKFNAKEMPKFPLQRPGLLLPEEKDCLTAQSYQLSIDAFPKAQSPGAASAAAATTATAVTAPATAPPPAHSPTPVTTTTATPPTIITNNNNSNSNRAGVMPLQL
eukprot:gene19101-25705_t